MQNLGALGAEGDSAALAINASGLVVGYAAAPQGQHAFLYNGQTMLDLNNLIPSNSGWTLIKATGINDAGQIVGIGGYNGAAAGFLLTPSCSQPVRPLPNTVILPFGAKPKYANGLLHNGTDYASTLANPILSVGPSGFIFDASTDGYTKATSAEFGSIDPNGKGPTIWVRYTLSTGAPVYVLYGHTAACPAPPCWNDQSTGSGKTFDFNSTYTVDWHSNDPIGIGTIMGYTAPYYLYGEADDHLHLGVFLPNKSCKGGTAYCEPPTNYWGYAPSMTFPGGTYIDPQLFFSDAKYCLAP
jgi:probable HAF family extracellular repeat protein